MRRAAAALGLPAMFMLLAFAPPSGRPPVGPLERYEPRAYDLSFTVALSTLMQFNANDRKNYDLDNAPIVMPVVFLSTFSKVDSNTVAGKLWLDSREDDPHLQLKSGFPFNTHLATLTIGRYGGQALRWQLGYRLQVWSSRIDDERAAQIAWPREWPKEVQDGLQPQKYIESNDSVFTEEVQKITNGKLRLVAPYLGAKDIIRHCINEIQITGNGTVRGDSNAIGAARVAIRGLRITGALEAARTKRGSPHDLVCVCVAMLRAAGIPARPIIGVEEDERGFADFVSWAEFYLPEAGWIPFDPYVMRGKGVRTLDVRKPWPELGTMKDLNKRVPLSFYFIPPASVESPQYPAVWGWDPRPGRDPSSDQAITMEITNRGKGVEDPK